MLCLRRCVAHLRRHRARFSPYIYGDFDEYVEEMETEGTWGDDVEIRVLEEV
ncbi:hypothetical protein EON63_24645 [archaeon]|nr:MAG: hypothetical protein EON63_24645 [archaeon]